ncbi:hypothetical protein IH981_03885, partial [Patescibacteria group bacterium]|nr:hypothetical protein [Patescibacteria group bacterium]
VVNGVSIRLAPNYNVFQRPALIDTNTSTGSFGDAALAVGQTFFDPIKNITIRTISKDSNRATVEISFGSQPCVRVNPSISVTPLSQWGDPGQTLSYQVRVTNNDSLACSSSTFLTTATLPAGFSQSPTSFSASLSPQNNLTRTINITSPNNAVDGFYTFTQTATNTSASAFSASVSANYNMANTAPVHPDGTLVRASANNKVFLVENNQRRHVLGRKVLFSHGYTFSLVRRATTADNSLSISTTFDFREGTLLLGSGPQVYVVDYEAGTIRKRHITSKTILFGLGYTFEEILRVIDSQLPSADGPAVQ